MHQAGEIVEVSPAEHDFLLSVQSAVDVTEATLEEKSKAKRNVKK